MRRRLGLGLALAGLSIAVVGAVLVVRTVRLAPATEPTVARVDVPMDAAAVARRLAEAIRIPTVSPQPPAARDPVAFERFVDWMEESYPLVHASLDREVLSGGSILFTWPGSDPDAKPVLLTAHYDVVPVVPGSESEWRHPPFSGAIEDGFVWGRGALDDKGSLVALLEATSALLEEGFRPEPTVYLAFGHDEELGGDAGAGAITELLDGRGVRLAWSLDEGSFVIDGMYPGVDVPVASINVAEKGYLTIDLVASAEGGHSSIPPAETAATLVAQAIVRLHENPMPGGIDGVTAQSFDALAEHMPFPSRMVLANRWLFGGLVERRLAVGGPSSAILRTTMAPTMLSASIKENVLPTEAVATVNLRIHPRDSLAGALAHVERVIDDERVEVRPRPGGNEASRVSRTSGPGFGAVARAVAEVYGPVVVVPGLTVGGTDTRHYGRIADDAYRFLPIRIRPDQSDGFHGTNERVAVDDLAQAARVYVRLLRGLGEAAPPSRDETSTGRSQARPRTSRAHL